jgi:hypothetical protein
MALPVLIYLVPEEVEVKILKGLCPYGVNEEDINNSSS